MLYSTVQFFQKKRCKEIKKICTADILYEIFVTPPSLVTGSHGWGQTLSVFSVALLAVDDHGRAPRPCEAAPVLDLPDQVSQVLRFLRQLSVPPLQELEVFHLLVNLPLLTRTRWEH